MRRQVFAGFMLCAVAITSLVGTATSVWADTDRLQPDFTFRRVAVPQGGQSGGRIRVQIDPNAAPATMMPPSADESETAAEVASAAPRPDIPQNIAWFWQNVSWDMSASGPGRLADGLSALNAAPADARFHGPSLQALSDIARAHGSNILRETVGTQVSPALVLALISVESGGRPEVVSHAGAQGLMQLMPATAARFSVSNSLDPMQNIRGGVAYLDWLMGTFDNDPILVLAGYNAGEGSVREHGGVPPFSETRAYVPKVLAAWNVARGLCVTPPELMTDGCVFAVDGGLR